MSSLSLSTSQQQQLVYASLMRFGSETMSLRHRCLEHLVMNGLLGTTSDSPLKIGELQTKLHYGAYSPSVRPEVLRDTLLRLERENKVASVIVRKKKAYFLTQSGIEFVTEAVVSAETLYKPVLARLLKHTDHLLATNIGVTICTDFLCEAFSRCGLGIAKNLQGNAAAFPHQGDLSAAFSAAVDGQSISNEAKQTLETRCLALFKSHDLEDKRLIFYLTQGYYFAQLLGLNHQSFDPIAEQAFAGAVFYLDTNVLLPGLLPGDGGGAFIEMIRVAKRIGITLRITRASINEARRVAADRLNELKSMQDVVPAELAERSLDDFVTNFYAQRLSNPQLTPDEYLHQFERLSATMEQWGVEIDDITEDEMLRGRSYPVLETSIQERSAHYRKGRTKSESVLRHDVAHYALVETKRESNSKTWFLTRDRSLMSSAEGICKSGMPFCFSLIGFLQSISPYVSGDVEGNSLSVVFSELLKEQLITTDRLFDSRELVLLAEMHSDVLATAAENLLPAVDFVKFSVLKGKAYRQEDLPLVSLELRKFLASSADEQKRALESLNAQLESEAQMEREAAAESRQAMAEAERTLLTREEEMDEQADKLESSELETAQLREQLATQRMLVRLAGAIIGFIVGALMWLLRVPISAVAENIVGHRQVVDVVLEAVAAIVFSFPSLNFLRKSGWKTEIKFTFGTILICVAMWTIQMISPSKAADVASYLAIATSLVSMFVLDRWKS